MDSQSVTPDVLLCCRDTIGTTENNVVPGFGMYEAVLQGVWEIGVFEDILVDEKAGSAVIQGQPKGARVGLYMSSACDVWKDNEQSPTDPNVAIMTFGTNTRALYTMLLHFGWRVDILVEEDVMDKQFMADYQVLYLSNAHVSSAASAAIADWAMHGKTHVMATAGAGMLDEYNRTNTVLQGLFGVTPTAMRADPMSIAWVKQE